MNVLTLYRRAAAAKSSLEGLLSVAKMQNYQRLDEHTGEMAMVILTRPDSDETVQLLMKDLDAFVDGVALLKAEIAARRFAAK